jgi:hypothetical protein
MGNARWGPRPGRALAWLAQYLFARFARLGRVASRPDGPVLIRRSAARTARAVQQRGQDSRWEPHNGLNEQKGPQQFSGCSADEVRNGGIIRFLRRH